MLQVNPRGVFLAGLKPRPSTVFVGAEAPTS